jgi:pyruvate/2-oxoglutarate dehydrogenase complex dihydrolipoamide dehydrogenase (E3) component
MSAAPGDAHDRRLLEQVAPVDWINPTPRGRYNLVVLGAGTAGLVTAAAAAALGAEVALVEREALGGECLNTGCVPSKALLRAARAVSEARGSPALGARFAGPVGVDFGAVMERMRRLRADLAAHDSAARFRGLGVDVYLGRGRFTGPDALEVAGRTLRFARACIATGSRPQVPPIPGLDQVRYHTNETIFALTELPRRLAVLGGGPIGCELAQAFARFGSRVALIERAGRVLAREDSEAAEAVQRALSADGVELLLGNELGLVRRGQGASVALELAAPDGGGARRVLEVDELLVAVGRAPNVADLGLEDLGVAFDGDRGVHVDDFLRTTNRRVFAAGDVCSEHKFTHAAEAAAGIVVRNALFFGRARASALFVPRATYTAPEVAVVGLTEEQARAAGLEVDVLRVDLASVDRAVLDGAEQGFLKLPTQRGTDRMLGATLVAGHAGELISEVTLAMVSGAGLRGIAATIHPYPTQAAVLQRAAVMQMKTRLTPRRAKWLARFLAWRR